MQESAGHIAFVHTDGGTVEFFRRDGDIFRAPASAPVMIDGYRIGRWEGPDRRDTWNYLQRVFGITPPEPTNG